VSLVGHRQVDGHGWVAVEPIRGGARTWVPDDHVQEVPGPDPRVASDADCADLLPTEPAPHDH
jgi:hypothetical protein